MVTTANHQHIAIKYLDKNTSIHCPFGTHTDNHHSAFVILNSQGIRGVSCRGCGETQWTQKTPPEPADFNTFDNLVHEHTGKANTHFEYRGLSQYDHDLEISLSQSNFHITNDQHVSLPIEAPGIHLIKSPKGTGKTHALAQAMQAFKSPAVRKKLGITGRSILIGHRQTLIKESATKLGMECYLDTKTFDRNIVIDPDQPGKRFTDKPQNYAICLDSLHSRIRPSYEQYDIVIIDESEQVFSHFLSKEMRHPERNFKALEKLIRNAKYVYCLDADLDRITLTGVVSCLRNLGPHQSNKKKQIYFHLNKFKRNCGEIDVYPTEGDLTASLLRDLKANLRVFVSSNSKKLAERLYASHSERFPDKRFMLITSDTAKRPETQSFIKFINSEILNYDAVFASPSIGTGIDITFPENATEIDVVYGFFKAQINTHFDIDQQISRVRHPGSIKVYIDGGIFGKTTDFLSAKRELLNDPLTSGINYEFNEYGGHWGTSDYPYIDLITEVVTTRNKSINNFKHNFINYKRSQGWAINFIASNDADHTLGAAISQAGSRLRRRSRTANLLSVKAISFREATNIRDKFRDRHPVTRDESYALERYRIEHFYHEPLTEDLITFDAEGKTQAKIRLFQLVTDPALKIQHFDDIIWSRPDLFKYSQTTDEDDIKKAVFLREAFNAAGLFCMSTMQFHLDAIYDKRSLVPFVGFIQAYSERYQLLFDKIINSHVSERATNQLNSLLKLIALKQQLIKANKGGGTSRYSINPTVYSRIQSITEKHREHEHKRSGE